MSRYLFIRRSPVVRRSFKRSAINYTTVTEALGPATPPMPLPPLPLRSSIQNMRRRRRRRRRKGLTYSQLFLLLLPGELPLLKGKEEMEGGGGGGEIKIQSTAFCLFTVTAAHQWRPNSTRRDFDLAVLLLIARFFLAADDILFLPTVASTRFSSSFSSSFFFFYCYYHFEFLCHRLVFQIKKKKKKKKKKDINSSRLASSFDIKMGFKCAAIAAGDLHQSRPFFVFVFVLILFLSSHLPILCTSP